MFPTLSQTKSKPYFTFEKIKTKTLNENGIHSMWIGIKNPLKVTFSDSTVKFSVTAKGAQVLNYKQNKDFNIIPKEKNIILYMINEKRDTMASFRFFAKSLDCPMLELNTGKTEIKDQGYVLYKDISKITLTINHDPRLETDLLETPIYSSNNVNYILIRKNLSVGEYKSISELSKYCKKGDQVTLYISGYHVKNSLGDIINLRCTDILQFQIK